jgi:ketosteroid isomerase-like protein
MKRQIAFALIVLALYSCNTPTKEEVKSETPSETPAVAVVQKPVEFADEKFNAICKDGMNKLAAGDIDGFLGNFADDIIYRWNNGDSLAGKPAVTKYWTERRKNVITKLEFSQDIWLPLTVTEASTQNVRKGTWVLAWYKADATYKTGKSMSQYMHMLYHFNNAGKIDEVIHYLDRGIVAAAAGK